MNLLVIATIASIVLLTDGCNRTNVIPERLEGKVDRDLRYADIKDNPQADQGKLMLAGGKVLSAHRKQDGTHIEVLQIPLSQDLIPDHNVAESKGRLKRGTVYVTLGRMEDKGFICARTEEAPEGAGGLPRRLYQATPLGLRVHRAWSLMLRELKTLKPAATK